MSTGFRMKSMRYCVIFMILNFNGVNLIAEMIYCYMIVYIWIVNIFNG